MSVDPLAEKFNNLTPYHYVMNNPLLYVDPDGRDTLRMNRQFQETIGNTDIWKVNFTYIKDGVESPISLPDGREEIFMFGNHSADSKPGNSLTQKEIYSIKFQKMESKKDNPKYDDSILLDSGGRGKFLHVVGKNVDLLDGCKTLCTDYESNNDKVTIKYSHYTLKQVRELHDSVKENLTGEKFQLRNISN